MNHVMGRSPMNRMWMQDTNNDGWGPASTENPYFNLEATHSYSLGNDFNHQSNLTQYYTQRVIKHWIENFKIDGVRWDLTKGFTQNCNAGDDNCTNSYQQDRVDVLKSYADYSWSLDPDHYVIFEHLGSDEEEKEQEKTKLVLTLSRKFTLKLLDSTCCIDNFLSSGVERMRFGASIQLK